MRVTTKLAVAALALSTTAGLSACRTDATTVSPAPSVSSATTATTPDRLVMVKEPQSTVGTPLEVYSGELPVTVRHDAVQAFHRPTHQWTYRATRINGQCLLEVEHTAPGLALSSDNFDYIGPILDVCYQTSKVEVLAQLPGGQLVRINDTCYQTSVVDEKGLPVSDVFRAECI